jgi:myo-inositol-1(or 4)-monophosphatase
MSGGPEPVRPAPFAARQGQNPISTGQTGHGAPRSLFQRGAKPVNDTTRIAVEAARRGGAILREGLAGPMDVAQKAGRELVTALDSASEEAIIATIRGECPDDLIVAEESAPEAGRGDRVWIVDPLDGTNNYAHGYPFFSVAIAVEECGSLVGGVVYDPLRDELFVAERGGGATLNGLPIHVSGAQALNEALVATGFPYDRTENTDNNLANLNRFILAVRGIRRGGSAELDLSYVAAGRLDGFWELCLKTWDVSAGGLIVREAGGTVTNFDGAGWDHRSGDIVASNGRIHEEMLALV